MSNGGSSINWHELKLIAVFGGSGGFVSWVYSIVLGQPIGLPWWSAIPCSILLGAAASFIGVYVITNTDTKALNRCLGFALLCGLLWKPVIDAGGALIKQATIQQVERKVLNLSKSTEKLAMQLKQTPTEELASKIDGTAMATVDLLREFPKVENPDLRPEIQNRTLEVVNAIKEVTPQKPEEAAKALTKLGVAAVETKETQIANVAIQSLVEIGIEAKDPRSTVPLVYWYIGNIAKTAEAKDNPKLAIESRYKGAQAVLGVAKSAEKEGNIKVLQEIPLKDAQNDLTAARKFYESIDDLNKAKKAEAAWGEIGRIITKVPPR